MVCSCYVGIHDQWNLLIAGKWFHHQPLGHVQLWWMYGGLQLVVQWMYLKVGSSTYCKTSLGGMPMFIFSSLDHRHSQMLASNNNLVDFPFFYGQMSTNPNFIHTMMQNTFMLKCGKIGCKCVLTNSNQISPFMWEQLEVINWGVVEKRPLTFNKPNKVLKILGKVVMLLMLVCNT